MAGLSGPFTARLVDRDEFGSNEYQDTFGGQWCVGVYADISFMVGSETLLFACGKGKKGREAAHKLAVALNKAYHDNEPEED